MSATKTKHFLVVENDANDAFFIDRALRCAPHCKSTFICRSGSEAKAYLSGAGIYLNREKYPLPDVVITDLRMVNDSGAELVEWMRAQKSEVSQISIIMLTGSTCPSDLARARAVGAQRIVEKPGNFEDFKRVLTTIALDVD